MALQRRTEEKYLRDSQKQSSIYPECNRLCRNINHTCRPELCISLRSTSSSAIFDLRYNSFCVCRDNHRPDFHYDSMALCFGRSIRLWSEHGHGFYRRDLFRSRCGLCYPPNREIQEEIQEGKSQLESVAVVGGASGTALFGSALSDFAGFMVLPVKDGLLFHLRTFLCHYDYPIADSKYDCGTCSIGLLHRIPSDEIPVKSTS